MQINVNFGFQSVTKIANIHFIHLWQAQEDSQIPIDLFDDVTQNCDFLCFPSKQKFIPMNRFIVPNLDNL